MLGKKAHRPDTASYITPESSEHSTIKHIDLSSTTADETCIDDTKTTHSTTYDTMAFGQQRRTTRQRRSRPVATRPLEGRGRSDATTTAAKLQGRSTGPSKHGYLPATWSDCPTRRPQMRGNTLGEERSANTHRRSPPRSSCCGDVNQRTPQRTIKGQTTVISDVPNYGDVKKDSPCCQERLLGKTKIGLNDIGNGCHDLQPRRENLSPHSRDLLQSCKPTPNAAHTHTAQLDKEERIKLTVNSILGPATAGETG